MSEVEVLGETPSVPVEPGDRTPRQLVVGSTRHAVTAYALALGRAVDRVEAREPGAVRVRHPREAITALPGIRNLHVQFTDRLFGDSPEEAAERIEQLAHHVRLTVTLHDLPQPSDGAQNLPRRAAAYARVARAARGVVCNSGHEALLLAEFSIADLPRDPAVIPLHVGAAAHPHDPAGRRGGDRVPEAAILGYFYPGKGHEDVVAAVARSGTRVAVAALGTAAPGHESEFAAVAASARALGVDFTASGYLDDAELLERCRTVAVPVAAHQHLSASASINTWIAAGRRPLVLDGRYAREMAALRPGTVTLYEAGTGSTGLGAAIKTALEHPETTWIAPGTSIRPDLADTTEAHLAWWEGLE